MHERVLRARRLEHADARINLVGRRHARRHDHRPALPRDVLQQRQVRQLARSGLERRHAQVSRKSAASRENGVERNMMPSAGRPLRQLVVRLPGQRRPRQQIEQRLADVRGGLPAAQHLVFGEMRLEFDRVGAGLGRRVHQFRRQPASPLWLMPASAMTKHGAARTNVATPDGQMCSHVGFTLAASRRFRGNVSVYRAGRSPTRRRWTGWRPDGGRCGTGRKDRGRAALERRL